MLTLTNRIRWAIMGGKNHNCSDCRKDIGGKGKRGERGVGLVCYKKNLDCNSLNSMVHLHLDLFELVRFCEPLNFYYKTQFQ